MRGADGYTETMFTMSKLDDFVPASHPLRPIRLWLNDALKRMDPLFARMYESDARGERPSIAPEKLIRALLLPDKAGRVSRLRAGRAVVPADSGRL
ncbi:hypothetical protein BX592_104322 [Paraburkholderia rhizosphaerae]|uniref:Transposase InsH N-terminal domain-containing protein n=1 Tax=Paraburkholderia rhizosphaerae TaxID=480658 RepID=A0A4R8M0X0_9BURK|nr:hypothetical protein BX592_104322 [Paraburkholderia rhizosphaerae]